MLEIFFLIIILSKWIACKITGWGRWNLENALWTILFCEFAHLNAVLVIYSNIILLFKIIYNDNGCDHFKRRALVTNLPLRECAHLIAAVLINSNTTLLWSYNDNCYVYFKRRALVTDTFTDTIKYRFVRTNYVGSYC